MSKSRPGAPTAGTRANAGDGRARFGDVPVTRRILAEGPRRFAASIAGVGLALMLVLLLDGLSAGIDARITVYEEQAGAPLFVAQPGASSLLGSTSVLPKATMDQVRADPDVTWTSPIRGFFSVPEVGGTKIPSYVVGWQPGQRGGPWELAEGRAPSATDEVAVGEQFLRRGRLQVGDPLDVVGAHFRIVGVAKDADMFMASFVFMTHEATDVLLHAPDTTSFLLVGSNRPEATEANLAAQGLNVLTQEQIKQGDLALKGQTYGTALTAMVLLAASVGTLVIALAIYSAITDRSRDYGIIKALGSTNARLFRLAAAQSVSLALVGFVVGLGLFAAGAAFLRATRPQFAIVVSSASLGRLLAVAVLMGLVATFVPARHLAAMEPAHAFKGA